jgi:hypothetical protein
MPSSWGPSNEELTNAQSHQFSANLDNLPLVDPLGGEDKDDSDESEVEDDEDMDDHFGHLFDLAEAAHFVDVYHTDEGIAPLCEDITLHASHSSSTPNNSPRKRSHL